jgi:N-acyl-D-amino-acid deacylase
MASFNTRVDRMTEILNDKSVLVALGDGGAHVDMMCDAGYPTYLLGTRVGERQALTLEEGCGGSLRIRSRSSASGAAAGSPPAWPPTSPSSIRGERRFDLPGGAKRIVIPSRGFEYTVVNSAVTWQHGKLTGAAAGQMLRS